MTKEKAASLHTPKSERSDFILSCLWGLLTIALITVFSGKAADDFFITYRYAWNLAHGAGFTFNPGEPVFGLTNPGLGLLLAALYVITRIPIHILGTLLFGLALWGLATWLLITAGSQVERWIVRIGGTLVISSTVLWINHGSEALIVLLLLAVAARIGWTKPVIAGLLAGASVWFRPDAAVGVALLILLLWLDERRIPWKFGGTAIAFMLFGAGVAGWYFGEILPTTLEAKRTMAQSRAESWTGPIRFWQRSVRILVRHWGDGVLLIVGMGIAGLWPLVVRAARPLRLVVLYGIALSIAYPILGVPFFPWYAVPPVVTLLFGLAALGVTTAWELSEKWAAEGALNKPIFFNISLTALILSLPVGLMTLAGWNWLQSFQGYGRYETYRLAAEWVREHSLPSDRLAYGEIGVLAYFSQRPVDDLMGLTTPRSLPYVLAGDGEGAFLASPPDFFFDHPDGPHRGIVHRKWFRQAYELVATISPADSDKGSMRVFRRRSEAALPAARPPRPQQSR